MPYFSFVLVCYNKWNLSRQAITTLINSFDDSIKSKGIELLIVNNGSTDETSDGIEELKTIYDSETLEIREIYVDVNMGYGLGLNIGLAESKGEIITILNNDLIFTSGWFKGLTEILEKDKTVGMAVPYLSYAATVQNTGVLLDSREEIDSFALKFMEENKEKIVYTENIISACVSFRRDLLTLIGGFDFWFGMAMADDTDWSLRANITGLRIAVVGSSFVYHIGNATFATVPEATSAAIDSNHPKFMVKWNLKGNENPEGFHNSFQEIIANNNYLRKKHYFPTKINEFNLLPGSLLNKEGNIPRKLLVADWTNVRSQWRARLSRVIQEGGANQRIYLWIPQQYFKTNELVQEVTKLQTFPAPVVLKFFHNNIFPVDLLRFLKSFDIILSVENDYVNKYIISLAKEIDLPVN